MKAGDTLIEVTLAIGIFAMVAITIAAVVSGSMSSAQISLETTVTREQIDAQAEALRYIHASYIAGGPANDAGEDRYIALWREIVGRAENHGESFDFVPTSCEELYTRNDRNGYLSLEDQGAFIINSHALYTLNTSHKTDLTFDQLADNIVVTPGTSGNGIFRTAVTYPRVVYQGAGAGNEETLIGQGVGTTVGQVEGLYVIPVRDESSTMMVESVQTINGISTVIKTKAAYYDFYIRSCWFGAGADRPSTISTVIRLYDPNVIDY